MKEFYKKYFLQKNMKAFNRNKNTMNDDKNF